MASLRLLLVFVRKKGLKLSLKIRFTSEMQWIFANIVPLVRLKALMQVAVLQRGCIITLMEAIMKEWNGDRMSV